MFDKKKFVESMIKLELSLNEIIKEARKDSARAESSSFGVKGAPENGAAESGDYVRFLDSLVNFLKSGTMPAGISNDDFQLLHGLTKYLVKIGNFKPVILELFGAASED